jgi:hypothetical protein
LEYKGKLKMMIMSAMEQLKERIPGFLLSYYLGPSPPPHKQVSMNASMSLLYRGRKTKRKRSQCRQSQLMGTKKDDIKKI